MSILTLPTPEQAADILYRAIPENASRLQHGSVLRAKMHESIENGENPTGYRVQWLKSTAIRVIDELRTASEEFNSTFSDDRISTDDLSDVLKMVDALFGLGAAQEE